MIKHKKNRQHRSHHELGTEQIPAAAIRTSPAGNCWRVPFGQHIIKARCGRNPIKTSLACHPVQINSPTRLECMHQCWRQPQIRQTDAGYKSYDSRRTRQQSVYLVCDATLDYFFNHYTTELLPLFIRLLLLASIMHLLCINILQLSSGLGNLEICIFVPCFLVFLFHKEYLPLKAFR